MLELLFFLAVAVIVYVFIGYPLLARLLSSLRSQPVGKEPIEPLVTILIAAFNEAGVIGETLKDKLDLDYPKDKLDVIVISDGSTDGTDEIVMRYADQPVKLLRQVPRAGKTSALNMAVPLAKGEVLVFSDANSRYESQSLRRLVRNFADPKVGYVTGKMIYTNPDGTAIGDGCTAYMRYENALRKTETRLGSVVGVDGGIDAVRKEIYQPMRPDQLPDFVLPLKVVEKGYRVVYEPEAVLKENALGATEDEYRMRVRVTLRALWALSDMKHLLSLRQYGLFALQLWSHKLLRYMSFAFLAAAFVTNLLLWPVHVVYRVFAVVQLAAYSVFLLQLLAERAGVHVFISRFLHYFLLLNVASAHAFYKFVRGQKQVTWTPRKG